MWQGRQRKRLIKLARRQFTAQQLRDMVQPSPDAHPVFCVVRCHGYELLRMWSWPHGLSEVTMEDDVCFFAIQQHLKERGLVFESDAEALEYGRQHGLPAKPAAAGPAAELGFRGPGGGVAMPATTHERYDREARRLGALLPDAPRVAVLGSTDFWHPDSPRTCAEIGRLLAAVPGLVLLTGGVEGIGEAVGRSFFRARRDAGQEPRVYHVLPEGEEAWDYGETLFAGADMTERREVLGRLSRLFVLVEGGPRAGHEVEVATGAGAVIIPVGRSGGYAATLYGRLSRPPGVSGDTWAALGSGESTPEDAAGAVLRAVQACLTAPA